MNYSGNDPDGQGLYALSPFVGNLIAAIKLMQQQIGSQQTPSSAAPTSNSSIGPTLDSIGQQYQQTMSQAKSAFASPPPVQGPDAQQVLADRKAALLNSIQQISATPPPTPRPPTLGTRDLTWALPALLGLFGGPNGQQLAAGLVQGGIQQNKQASDARNQAATAQYQFGQAQKQNQVQLAQQQLLDAQAKSDAAAREASLARPNLMPDFHFNEGKLTTFGQPEASQPDFYGRYSPGLIGKVQSQVQAIGDQASPGLGSVLVSKVQKFPLEIQAKAASLLVGSLTDNSPSGLSDANRQKQIQAYDMAIDALNARKYDVTQRQPLTPQEEENLKAFQTARTKLDNLGEDGGTPKRKKA